MVPGPKHLTTPDHIPSDLPKPVVQFFDCLAGVVLTVSFLLIAIVFAEQFLLTDWPQ